MIEESDKFRRRPKHHLFNQLETKLENVCSVLQKHPESVINISIKQKFARVNSKLKVPRNARLPKDFLDRQNFFQVWKSSQIDK